MHTRCFPKPTRWLSALAMAGLLAGCAHTASNTAGTGPRSEAAWQTAAADRQALAPAIQSFLDEGGLRATAVFDQSPWGEQAELRIENRYFAGSGRTCVRLHVTAGPRALAALACRQNRQWVPVRPVTQQLNIQEKG